MKNEAGHAAPERVLPQRALLLLLLLFLLFSVFFYVQKFILKKESPPLLDVYPTWNPAIIYTSLINL